MEAHLSIRAPVTALHGVGPAVNKKLQQLSITTVEELLWHLPFRYEDYRTLTAISDVQIGQNVTVAGTIEIIASRRSWKRRMTVTEALVRDTTGTLKAVWFNQPYLATTLKANDRVMLAGKASDRYGGLQLASPAYEKMDRGETLHVGRLVPIYPTTGGLTERQLRYCVSQALRCVDEVEESLPEGVLAQERLMSLSDTIRTIHFPKDEHDRDRALERLKFDELLLFHLRRMLDERGTRLLRAPKIPFDQATIRSFVRSIPFELTQGQRKAAWDILQDLERDTPMNRLLEGDVGSGKTVVAAIAGMNVVQAGWNVVLMAPTEILARQHFLTLTELFGATSTPVVLWTGAFHELHHGGKKYPLAKRALKTQLPKHGACVIGTQALLEDRASLDRLGLIIVDEQHRFGVAQRQSLQQGGRTTPHFLSLTATPIPRSLAIALAGDLRLSILSTLPKGRKPIVTRFLPPHQREALYRRVDTQLAAGRQAFVIAPLIEASDRLGVASATALVEELAAYFPKRRLGLLHGKLTSKAKDATLAAFVNHEFDLLVATPVVEVGIDVPNATIMVIEAAERFGLAQLHQLRGRVGRGRHQSYCFLLPTTVTRLAKKRLDAVTATSDGFRLAQLDLELRGPGDLVGTAQSGFLDFRFASLGDHALLERSRVVAATILEKDPNLKQHSLLRKNIAKTAIHKE